MGPKQSFASIKNTVSLPKLVFLTGGPPVCVWKGNSLIPCSVGVGAWWRSEGCQVCAGCMGLLLMVPRDWRGWVIRGPPRNWQLFNPCPESNFVNLIFTLWTLQLLGPRLIILGGVRVGGEHCDPLFVDPKRLCVSGASLSFFFFSKAYSGKAYCAVIPGSFGAGEEWRHQVLGVS